METKEKLVILSLQGNFQKGCTATVEVFSLEEGIPQIGAKGQLPSNTDILKHYQQWQKTYQNLGSYLSYRIKRSQELQIVNIATKKDIEPAFNTCRQAAEKLENNFNSWLDDTNFLSLKQALLKYLKPEEEFRILLKTDTLELRRLPWNQWKWLKKQFPKAEIALTSPEFERIQKLPPTPSLKNKVRILAILGNAIDPKSEKKILETLSGTAEIEFYYSLTGQKLKDLLKDKHWDIFFFAGHSDIDADGKGGKFQLSETEQLTIADVKNSLKIAINNGLQLAIFNSCNGLGLAQQLAEGQQLYLPQIIVMREPIPDQVAPKFLDYFLQSYTQGTSLYTAIHYAKQELETLENRFPCASWLPVIVQNPGEIPPRWQDLGLRKTQICPYKGLSPFQSQDADFFFGRETFTRQLFQDINTKPLIAIIGASGAGKSSIVFAGLLPCLDSTWTIVSFRPGNHPFDSLATALFSLQTEQPSRLDELKFSVTLQHQTQALSEFIIRLNANHLLLVVDQFEELYTLCPKKECEQFLDVLVHTVNTVPNITLLLTLRSDFLGETFTHPQFFETLIQGWQRLDIINPEELKSVIEKPAKKLNVLIEPGLTNLILNDVGEESGNLPLLEFTLTQLWQHLKTKKGRLYLSHEAYQQIGGVKQALAQYANQVYDQLTPLDKLRAEQIFIQLVTTRTEESSKATRRVATRSDIGEKNWDLVIHLASSRLLVTDDDKVEIVHETLIQHWELLQEWLKAHQQFRYWQDQLRLRIGQWKKSNRDESQLLQGKLLQEAQTWQQKRPEDLTSDEQKFIEFSKKQRTRIRRKTRLTVGSIAGLVIISSIAGIFAWYGQQQAKEEQLIRYATSGVITLENAEVILQILPNYLKSANKKHKNQQIEQALADYREIITVTQNLAQVSAKIQIQNIHQQAESSLAQIIRQYRLPQLKTELSQGNFGQQIDSNFSLYENQYTGALRLTYAILMREMGAYSDRNNDGELNEGEGVLIPCETLQDIEDLWREYTENRCYWYDEVTHLSPQCQELDGKDLTGILVYPPAFIEMEKRLEECKIE